jgi:RimJ/RimL family protein N-acetyltransferase
MWLLHATDNTILPSLTDSRMHGTVELRDIEPGDLPFFFEHQRDPIAVEMVAFRSRDRAAFDEHWAKVLANDGTKQTVVVDGHLAGYVASWIAEGTREVGYWLDRAYWGRGIATEALRTFLRLEETRPIYAGVAKHNLGSIRVLQKCGFKFVGPDAAAAEGDDASHVLFKLA